MIKIEIITSYLNMNDLTYFNEQNDRKMALALSKPKWKEKE